MRIPFTVQEFFKVFKQYNVAIFPFQFILIVLALICIIYTFKQSKYSARIILFILSFLWLWMGIVYHFLFFSRINKAAYLFGSGFVIQAMLFFAEAIKNNTVFKFRKNIFGVTAVCLLCYSLLIYPAFGYMQHHRFPFSPTFGLPCPTTIFTLGILMASSPKLPAYIFIIPVFWSLIGTMAAIQLSMKEDYGLMISALIFIIYAVQHKRPKATVSSI
jgi:hypothetical protein